MYIMLLYYSTDISPLTRQQALHSYQALFCRRCYKYDCYKHGRGKHSTKYIVTI